MSESAAGAIQHVHESRWYKILLPLVAPLADPAVKRIMNSPAFQVLFVMRSNADEQHSRHEQPANVLGRELQHTGTAAHRAAAGLELQRGTFMF